MTYPADIDEWRSDVRRMSETERAGACGHTGVSRNGTCYDCGERVDE